MPVLINYKKNTLSNNLKNLVLFVDENFYISMIKKYISKFEFNYVSDLLKTKNTNKKIIYIEYKSKKKNIIK